LTKMGNHTEGRPFRAAFYESVIDPWSVSAARLSIILGPFSFAPPAYAVRHTLWRISHEGWLSFALIDHFTTHKVSIKYKDMGCKFIYQRGNTSYGDTPPSPFNQDKILLNRELRVNFTKLYHHL